MSYKEPDLPESLGDYGEGVSEDRVNLETLRIMKRAVLGGWGIKQEWRETMARLIVTKAVDPNSSTRTLVTCARMLKEMNSQDMAIMFKLMDKVVADKVDHGQEDQARMDIGLLLENPEYVEHLRQQAVLEDSHASNAGSLSDAGNYATLANGSTSQHPGPGTNGHRNGSQ